MSAVNKASAELICQFQGHHESGLLSAAMSTPHAVINKQAAIQQQATSGTQESWNLSHLVDEK